MRVFPLGPDSLPFRSARSRWGWLVYRQTGWHAAAVSGAIPPPPFPATEPTKGPSLLHYHLRGGVCCCTKTNGGGGGYLSSYVTVGCCADGVWYWYEGCTAADGGDAAADDEADGDDDDDVGTGSRLVARCSESKPMRPCASWSSHSSALKAAFSSSSTR